MTLTQSPFYIAPVAVAPPLTSSLLSPLFPFLDPGRCFRTWVLTIYQFFYLFLFLRFFASTSASLPLTFRKLAGMAIFPNFPFLSAASNAILKPGGLLRWKKRLVKDARLSLPLIEVMKIARLTSPLLDTPRQSSPRPKLRHGRRLALLFHPNLTQKLYTLFFALSLALLPRLPPLLTSPTVLLPGNRLRSMLLT